MAHMSYDCTILSIDGGGIRGIIPAYILQQLEAMMGKPVYQCFDIVGGTSTGGLIALALTTPQLKNQKPVAPLSATAVLNLYLKDYKQIFDYQSNGDFGESKYYSPAPWMQGVLSKTMTLSQAQSNLKAVAGSGVSIPKQVFATTYTLDGPVPPNIFGTYMFNWKDSSATQDDYFVWEATLGTSAAPTYFPVANVGQGAVNVVKGGGKTVGSKAKFRWVADGGLASNNPTMNAVAWAFEMGLCTSLENVLVVSLGTGMFNSGIKLPGYSGDVGNWGVAQWASGYDTLGNSITPLSTALGIANVQVPDDQLSSMIPQGNYIRMECPIDFDEYTLDGDVSTKLLASAKSFCSPTSPIGWGYGQLKMIVAALT
jgi:patatin-like phospholipase/acyl hydrolase